MVNKKPGCLTSFLHWFSGSKPIDRTTTTISVEESEILPYHVRDDFLSQAEASFFRVLKTMAGDHLIICPKVSLAEIFYISHHELNYAYRTRIDRKHVDFVLCSAKTLKPMLAIELDDSSHLRPDRSDRDDFVDRVFSDAGLPLVRIPAQTSYDTNKLANIFKNALRPTSASSFTSVASEQSISIDSQAPLCPQCGSPMVVRTARYGRQAGRKFYGCTNYPHCRGIIHISDQSN